MNICTWTFGQLGIFHDGLEEVDGDGKTRNQFQVRIWTGLMALEMVKPEALEFTS